MHCLYLFREPSLELEIGTELVHGPGVEVVRHGGASPHPGQVQQRHPAVHPLQGPGLPQLSTGVGSPIISQIQTMMSLLRAGKKQNTHIAVAQLQVKS